MKSMALSQIQVYTKEHRKKKQWQKVVTAFVAIVVFITTYALILPAVTWERSLICEIPEHLHEEDCYEIITVPGGKELICSETEHTHGTECYIDVLTCGLEECAGHTHDDSCYLRTLVCAEEENEGHTHGEGCFNEAGELVCMLEESEGHIHSDACFYTELVCGFEEFEGHTHTDACYGKALVCQVPEHTHSDSCFAESEPHEEKKLICTLEEHEHTAPCFDAPPAEDDGFYCGILEHTHSEEQYCYFKNGDKRCTLTEHVHTLACRSNPNADVENENIWRASFEDLTLTEEWADDVIAIAETQIGYKESPNNYAVMEDGETMKGYTRYGDWYGDKYGDWCAMFCSFCMNYADVDKNVIPFNDNCASWSEALKNKELYHAADSDYEPKPGDLVFYDWDEFDPEVPEAREADHVGFVYEIAEDGFTTIEGNWEESVSVVERKSDDIEILGYGEMPENPVIIKERTIQSAPASDGAVAIVSGLIPRNAVATIEAVTLSEEELKTYFGEEKAAAMKSFIAYDIKILVDGVEWQPDDTVSVTVENPNITAPAGGLSVAHIESDGSAVTELDPQVVTDGKYSISVKTNGFSVYVFYLFTVDYYYENAEYHQDGLSILSLAELFTGLGIDRSVSDVTNVTFTRPDLLAAAPVEGDWTLTSLEAFKSEERLTIDFADGSRIEVKVFDATNILMEIPSNYNLLRTVTEADVLLKEFDVYNQLAGYGITENTPIASVTVTGTGLSSVTSTHGKPAIKAATEIKMTSGTHGTCTIVFDKKDAAGNDIACRFNDITADNMSRFELWDYSGGQSGPNAPQIIAGNFENLITPINGIKEWKYPTSVTDNSNIHTENAPVGFANAVFTTEGRDTASNYRINPIMFNGEKYYLYVATNSISDAIQNYNTSSYQYFGSPGVGTVHLGRFSRQNCSLPCIKGTLLLVCWIEDANGNRVVLPDVCIGNEGASNLWYWQFGGNGNRVIYTNDINNSGASTLRWDTSNNHYGTAVSVTNQGLFQGIQPDSDGYYVIRMNNALASGQAGDYVDELSVFRFIALSDVKKIVLDVNGNPVSGATQDFKFGAHYQPQVQESEGMTQDGKITEYFELSNGESHDVNGVVNSTFTAWEDADPYYTTTARRRVGDSTSTTALATTTETVTEAGRTFDRIRLTNEESITARDDKVTIEFVNQRKPTVTINKTFTGLTLEQIAALRDKTTDPFMITAVGQLGTFKLGLKQSEADDLIAPFRITSDGMTYTWELPIPGNYNITESGFSVEDYKCTTTVRSGNNVLTPNDDGSYTIEITGTAANAVTIENAYVEHLSSLTVTKTVVGSSTSTLRYPVRIRVYDDRNNPADIQKYSSRVETVNITGISYRESTEGSGIFDIVEFSIGNGGSFKIPIKPDYKVEIIETSHEGCTVSIDVTGIGEDTIEVLADRYTIERMPEADVTAAIKNTMGRPIPSTGGLSALLCYTIGALLIIGGALVYITCTLRRKKRKGGQTSTD